MPYVQRNEGGEIIGKFALKQEGFAEEFLADDHLDLQKSLNEAKSEKLSEIRKEYLLASLAPVECMNLYFDGGFESAIKLDAAMRLSQAAGALGVVFYDASNIGHELDFAEALQVCIAVAVAYQNALGKKQGLYAQVEAAQTVEELGLIIW